MANTKVRFGIIGLGRISNRFATVLNTCPEAELEAVAARSAERALAFKDKHQAKKSYGSYAELMSDPDVDIIYIGLTHNFHYEIAKQCIEHGKAVLCEKPFFLTRPEAEEVIGLAKQKNVLLMEAMWTRCLPSYLKMKEWLRDGKIGEIKYMDAQFCFQVAYDPANRLFDPAVAGGALYDAGVYPIELTLGLIGAVPDTVNSIHSTAGTGVDDFDLIGMHFPNGVIASLACGVVARTNPDAAVYGTKGYAVMRSFVSSKECALYDSDRRLVEQFNDTAEDGFIYQIRHVIDLYQTGRIESDLIPWADTIACAGIFDQLMAQWGKA